LVVELLSCWDVELLSYSLSRRRMGDGVIELAAADTYCFFTGRTNGSKTTEPRAS